MTRTTKSILTALADNTSGSFDDALSLPPSIYHDPEILNLEVDQIFRKDWICIGRLAEIPEAGDYICRDVTDSPVFVVRQKDSSVKAFANVCVHRAARLLDGEGHTSRISCPYHSWTYEITGQLIGAPFMKETKGFDVKDHRLKALACDTWEGFVYVNLNRDADLISVRLSELSSLVADFRMGDYVPVYSAEETWNTNWKCLVENFMDTYHLHRVHKDSFSKYGTSEDITHLFPGGDAFAYHLIQETEERNSVYPHAGNTWLKGDDRYKTYLINIFPSHVIQLQPDMLWYLSILPLGTEKVSIRWAVSIPAEILDGADDRQGEIDKVMELLHQVNSEDRPIVENVSQTTRSPEAARGPLSYLERNLWDFARYLARSLCS